MTREAWIDALLWFGALCMATTGFWMLAQIVGRV
jgi:hypothetical protein